MDDHISDDIVAFLRRMSRLMTISVMTTSVMAQARYDTDQTPLAITDVVITILDH
jgi:hypothetical protein